MFTLHVRRPSVSANSRLLRRCCNITTRGCLVSRTLELHYFAETISSREDEGGITCHLPVGNVQSLIDVLDKVRSPRYTKSVASAEIDANPLDWPDVACTRSFSPDQKTVPQVIVQDMRPICISSENPGDPHLR